MQVLLGPYLKPINIGQKKMAKKILFYFSFLLLFACFLTPVFAAQPIDDYLFQYEKYRQVYQEFTTARDKYLQYQTLSSKDEAIGATKKMIGQRNKSLAIYFLTLKWKLSTTPGVAGSEHRNNLISQLDKEITWLDDQNEQLEQLANPSLDDLFIISDRFEDKRVAFKVLSYQSLAAILLGKTRNLQSESVAIKTLLTDEVNQMEATKAAQFKGWLTEVENKNYLSQKEIEMAESQQESLAKKREKQLVSIYSKIQLSLERAKEYLNQAFLFQKEILNSFNHD